MKKKLGFIFSFALIIFNLALISCASTEVVEENPFVGVEPKTENKRIYDFGGMKIVIGDWYTNPEEKPTTTEEKNLKYWHEWTNATYNVNIEQKMLWGPQHYFDMVKNYCVKDYVEVVAGNPDESYVFIIDESIAQQGVRSGIFYDLATIEGISYFDSIKYNQSAVNRLRRGHSFYSFGWDKTEVLNGVYFNKRILQEHGYTSEYLYDLQAQGLWTWRNFENLCKKFTKDTDYDGDTDIWAMSSDMMDFANLCLASNGAALIRRDVNGVYYNNMISSKTSEAFEWMTEIWKKYQYPKAKNDTDDYYFDAFIKGKTAFLIGHQDRKVGKRSLANMMDDYGFICFPQGPRGERVYNTVVSPKLVVIPAWYDKERVEKIVKALDLYLTPVPTNAAYDGWKKNYTSLFRDARASAETLEFMGENQVQRLDLLINNFPSEEIVYNILNGINTLEEEFFFKKTAINYLLDENNNFGKLDDYTKITEKEFKEQLELELKLYEELKLNQEAETYGDDELPEIESTESSDSEALPDAKDAPAAEEVSEKSDSAENTAENKQNEEAEEEKKGKGKKKNKKNKKAKAE